VHPAPELVTIVLPTGEPWDGLTAGRGREALEGQALPDFLPRQRWYADKGRRMVVVGGAGQAVLDDPGSSRSWLLSSFSVDFADGGDAHVYFLPLALDWESKDHDPLSAHGGAIVAKVRRVARVGVAFDATQDPAMVRAFTRAILDGRTVPGVGGGALRCLPTEAGRDITLPPDAEAGRLGKEQSNTSMRVGDDLILKVYRRLEAGVHPEVEIGRFLTDVAGFRNIPPLYGSAEAELADGRTAAVGILQGFVRNQGDGWQYTLDYLDRFLEQAELKTAEEMEELAGEDGGYHGYYVSLARTLGQRVAEMHRAFALETGDPAFDPEPLGADDLELWRDTLRGQAKAAKKALKAARSRLEDGSDGATEIDELLDHWKTVKERINSLLTGPVDAVKTRLHGDLHLGQVVVVKDDWFLLDFEGEPAKSLEDRRRKNAALRDVAGILRSFNYAAWAALFNRAAYRPDCLAALEPWAADWEREAAEALLGGYNAAIGDCRVVPADAEAAQRLLDAFTLEKALYEIAYEADNRPDWLRIPIQGVRRVLRAPVGRPDTTASGGETT